MKIHHLNCGTLCPLGGRLVGGAGCVLSRARLVCHCLLVEGTDGLVLVDTGLGTGDVQRTRGHLPAQFRMSTGPVLDLAETAAHQVERLGFRRADVRHIVVTHLDVDHAGGLPDFPDAEVHVLDDELCAALRPGAPARYRAVHWAHRPKWHRHRHDGERWFGFDSVRALTGAGDVLLVPLAGHTEGHCAVAVRRPGGWLLHSGDAYFFRGEVTGERATPAGVGAFARMLAIDEPARAANVARLAALAAGHPEVTVFSSHDPVEYDRLATVTADHAAQA